MKPRGRRQQKQDGRMVLQNRDHRDVLINDVYHNFVYYVDKNKKEHLAWQKYPERACAIGIVCGGNYGYNSMSYNCILDIERHMLYPFRTNTLNTYSMLTTRDYFIQIIQREGYSWYATSFAVSKDGMIAKRQTEEEYGDAIYHNYPTKIGDTNSIMSIWNDDGHTIHPIKWEILNYNEKDYSFNIRRTDLPTKTFSDYDYWPIIIGKSNNGCIIPRSHQIGTSGSSNYLIYTELYNVDAAGNWSLLGDLKDFPERKGDNYYRAAVTNSGGQDVIVRCKGYYFLAWNYEVPAQWIDPSTAAMRYGYDWNARIVVSKNGRDWTGYGLGNERGYTYRSGNRLSMYSILVCRKGRIYCYVYNTENKQTRLFTMDENFSYWYEMNLPAYRDIEFSKDGGEMIIPNPDRQYARVIFNPEKTPANDGTTYDVEFGRYLNAKELEFCTSYFNKGEMKHNDNDEADFGIWISSRATAGSNHGVFVYSPTMNFVPHEDMWAGINSWGGGIAYDYAIKGDYCYTDKYDPGESQYGEDMYVWDSYEEKFDILDQEKVNWDLYKGYAFNRVDKLPKKGEDKVIYIVPRTVPDSKTEQFVWNPDKKIFEKLSNATFDTSKYNYREKKVAYLPEVGDVGVIYVVPKSNEDVDPEDQEHFTEFAEYLWDSKEYVWFKPADRGMTYLDYMNYEVQYVVSLPDSGEDNKLYLVPSGLTTEEEVITNE